MDEISLDELEETWMMDHRVNHKDDNIHIDLLKTDTPCDNMQPHMELFYSNLSTSFTL